MKEKPLRSLAVSFVVLGSAVGLLWLTACQAGRTVPNAATVSTRYAATGIQPYTWVANSLLESNSTTPSLSAFGAAWEPVFAIQGNLTKLGPTINGLAANQQNGDIYVANYDFISTVLTNPAIVVFSNTANGNVSPKATLNSPAIGTDGITAGIALDPSGNIWVGHGRTGVNSTKELPSLLEFAHDAITEGAENASPIAKIAGSKTMLDANIDQVTTDKSGNVYAVGNSMSPVEAVIAEFAAGTNGNKPPIRYIAGAATGLPQACSQIGIAVDTEGYIYEANGGGYLCQQYKPIIRIFLPSESGNVPPATVIQGPDTLLNQPVGVAVDESGNIYVADNGADETLVFASGASGDATPIRVLPLNPGPTPPSAITLCDAAPPCEGTSSAVRLPGGAVLSRFAWQH